MEVERREGIRMVQLGPNKFPEHTSQLGLAVTLYLLAHSHLFVESEEVQGIRRNGECEESEGVRVGGVGEMSAYLYEVVLHTPWPLQVIDSLQQEKPFPMNPALHVQTNRLFPHVA